jgi:hypothetical protein
MGGAAGAGGAVGQRVRRGELEGVVLLFIY